MQQNKNNKNKNKNNNRTKKTKIKKASVAMTKQIVTQGPQFLGGRDKTVICHKEFIKNIGGTLTFSCDNDGINPGNADVFPWLASVAISFESYRFRKLRFRYEPTAPTSQPGSVMMAIDYDCEDAAPDTKAEFLSYYGSCRSSPWASFSMDFDLARLHHPFYFVRGHTWPTDRKLYDCGQFLWGVEGINGVEVGEIWVEYEVELIHPQISDLNDPAYRLDCGASVTPTAPFGPDYKHWGNIGVSIKDFTKFRFTMHRSGEYLLIATMRGVFYADPSSHFSSNGANIGVHKTNYLPGVSDVYVIVPFRTIAEYNWIGWDLSACMSSVAVGQGALRVWIVPCSFRTATGLDINPG
jgi:hypothetical protein